MEKSSNNALAQYLNFPDKIGKFHANYENSKVPSIPFSSLILGNAIIGIFIIDDNFKCIYANNEMANIIGYSEKEIVGSDIRSHLPKESKGIINRYVQRQSGDVLPGKYKMDFFRKGGERRTAEIAVSVLKSTEQQVYTVLNVYDISDHVHMVEAIEKKEEKYRLLVEKMEDFCFELDFFGNFTFVNESMINHSGYSKDELLGMNYLEFTQPEEKDRLFIFFSNIYETAQPGKLQFKAIKKDGSTNYYETKSTLKTDDTGKPIGFRNIAREISNQELSEKILQESEQQLKAIIGGSPVPTIVLNENRKITHWNKACEKLTGVKAVDIIGKGKHEIEKHFKRLTLADLLINGESLEEIKTIFNSDVKKSHIIKDAYEMEVYSPELGKNGKWLFITAVPLKNSENKTIGVIETLLDITQIKQAQDGLQKSEKKYRDLFQNVLDFIFIHDLKGNFIETNENYIAETGYTPNHIAKLNIIDLIPERFRFEFDDYLKRILEKGKDEGIITFTMPDGKERTLEYKNLLIYDDSNNPINILGSARDITSHLSDKRKLSISEEKYRTIIESIRDVYFEVDLTGNYTFFNEALVQDLGLAKEEIIGMNYTNYVIPEDKKKVFQFFNNIYKTGKIGRNLQFKVVIENRVNMDVELTASVIKDNHGKPVGFRGISRDITEKKRAEKNLLEMHQTLEKKVKDRTQELQNINTALEVLLKKREKDKQELEERVAYNIKEILEPHLMLLKDTPLDKHQKLYLEILESNFKEIASPFLQVLSDSMQKLTPTEVQVISLIKQNKLSKEIADYMGISPRTIEFHRDNIREKLGIKNKKINLKTYLSSMK